MNLKILLILGLFAMLTAALEIPCTLYLYPSKPDPENLYDATKSFVLPFGRVVTLRGVRFPFDESKKWRYEPQYHEKSINSVKYIVAQGNKCDLCWIVGIARGDPSSMIVDPPTPGEIYTFDKCLNYVEIGCDYLYPPYE